MQNRFTYLATGVGDTMLALALALRRSRKGHITRALLEGLVVTLTLFGMVLASKAMVLGDRVAAGTAAWAPVAALVVLSGALFLWAEGGPAAWWRWRRRSAGG